MDSEHPGLPDGLMAEKGRLETEIEASQKELRVALRDLEVSDVSPVADKIRALGALRSRLAGVNTLLGEAGAESVSPAVREG